MDRDVLTDSQWLLIMNLLPGRVGSVGVTAPDNRLFLEAVLWIIRTGSPWRDLPERFGHWQVVYNRFNRWSKKNVWERVFEALCQDPDFEYVMIDSTIVRAHQHAAGVKKGDRTIRRWGVVEVAFPQKSMRLWMPLATPSALS